MMELSLRCRYWSVLQVVAIVVCYRGKVLSERVQGCVGSSLSLSCPEMKVIQITAVVLGDSKCLGALCCIKDNSCTHNPNENHRTDVHRRCDYKQSCIVDVLKEEIYCGYFYDKWSNNDFERITYNCTEDPKRSTTRTFSRPDSTEDILRTEETAPEKEDDETASSTDEPNKEGSDQNINGHDENVILPVVMATVCLLVLIAIVVVTVIMLRKRWPKVSDVFEMTDIDGNEGILYANENQTMSLNNGSVSPIYSNDKIKKSRGKDAKASETYEVANNVYSLADDAGFRPTEDPNFHCNMESREDVYSVARDVGEPECAGSAADKSNEDDNVYCNMETREPAEAPNSPAQNTYDEAINWKESECKAVAAHKPTPAQKKKTYYSPANKTVPDLYTKVNKPSMNATTFDSKAEAKDKVSTSDVSPSPTYETESVYANEPALSPSCSVASKALSAGGSETENPYCEMPPSPVKLKEDDGSQTVVENDLYSH